MSEQYAAAHATQRPLVLASQSPRRAEFLQLMQFQFTTISANIDERIGLHESPEDAVARLAREKARAVSAVLTEAQRAESVVLASDTIVVIDESVLGKPTDFDDYCATLKRLSGRTHRVMTSVCATSAEVEKTMTLTTRVTFCELTTKDIQRYWQTKEPMDKAGGYGIQGIGGQFVESIKGSYSAVVGLPMVETRRLLNEFGVYA
ncbi:Maf family protein [Alteromonas oceanisediminis]|uniref:Maf family protein n=1 Tax=Alteromonas oceanisediminis TaxID=2836180 RepID=UPI001BDAFCD1|nr:Maf family protein [Alteromonas oceanisediminis]MBT0586884.1 septum formation inhibitor Maf [Alteromonas oceanisediminis]